MPSSVTVTAVPPSLARLDADDDVRSVRVLARVRDGLAHGARDRRRLLAGRRIADLPDDEPTRGFSVRACARDVLELRQQLRSRARSTLSIQRAGRAAAPPARCAIFARREAGAEAVAGDELEDLQRGVVQMAADPLALLSAHARDRILDSREIARIIGALELCAQPSEPASRRA